MQIVKQLRRIIFLLSFLKDDFEWLAMSSQSPDKAKKIRKIWRAKIEWILRDILTSTPNQDSFDQVFEELNSDWG